MSQLVKLLRKGKLQHGFFYSSNFSSTHRSSYNIKNSVQLHSSIEVSALHRVAGFDSRPRAKWSPVEKNKNRGNKKGGNSFLISYILSVIVFSFISTYNVFCDSEEKKKKGALSSKERFTSISNAVEKSTDLIKERMQELGVPGLSIQVSVNGKTLWENGFGYADVENKIPCRSDTVMRIASISKSLTMTSVAQLLEDDKLDLDVPIQKYLPEYPVKTVDNEEVTITTRHLLSHQSGIRHYKLKDPKPKLDNDNDKNTFKDSNINSEENVALTRTDSNTDAASPTGQDVPYLKQKRRRLRRLLNKARRWKEKSELSEFDLEEYYIKEYFDSLGDSMKIFMDDDLFFKPGSGFLYTTHGWTVVSAIIEAASGKSFSSVMRKLFHDLGLQNTYLDKHDPIIYNRARFYIRDKNGLLKNAPYVDNSYKWAGGGFLSTVADLIKFGNAMLYSYQHVDDSSGSPSGFLKSSTVKMLWKPLPGTKMGWDLDGGYGLGWGSVEEKEKKFAFCHEARHYVSHTGGAIGASSVLLIMPSDTANGKLPNGVVVAIICNMQGVGLNRIALKIAKMFEETE